MSIIVLFFRIDFLFEIRIVRHITNIEKLYNVALVVQLNLFFLYNLSNFLLINF